MTGKERVSPVNISKFN